MTIPLRYAPRRSHFPYWWVLATAAAAFIALGPIVAALVASVGDGGPRTAFASAPSGNYAVVTRSEESADVLFAVGLTGEEREIGRVAHIPGYASYGAVSPDNARVALVVVDGGTQARPIASLVVVELETGKSAKLTTSIDYLQTPVWARDGGSVVVTRTASEGPRATVQLSRVWLDAREETAGEASEVLGAYPVGFDGQGRLVHVVIDGRGSVAMRGGSELATLGAGITRDWRLNDDGSALAYVETVTADGVKYFARTASLVDGISAQGLPADDARQSLGVAWRPGSGQPTFGAEPSGAAAGVGAQGVAAEGFDVPLAYSRDGTGLAVQRWSGSTFAQPGRGSFELVAEDGSRHTLEGFSRFLGWAAR